MGTFTCEFKEALPGTWAFPQANCGVDAYDIHERFWSQQCRREHDGWAQGEPGGAYLVGHSISMVRMM